MHPLWGNAMKGTLALRPSEVAMGRGGDAAGAEDPPSGHHFPSASTRLGAAEELQP